VPEQHGLDYTQEQVKAKNKMIETVPSTAGSTPYFNPKTQRFHDPVTKRMVKTPAGPQSVMNPEAMKPMQGPTMPDAQTGLVLGSLNSMSDSLKELVKLTKKSLGIEEKEFAADKFESAREGLEGSDLDAGDTDKPPDTGKGGFLEGIKGAFGKLRAPSLGTKGKLLLLAAGLYGLTTFSETIVKTLAPVLEWLDKTITSLKSAYKKGGMGALKDEFMTLVAKPALSVLGLTWSADEGIHRLKGSWLDLLDPFTGPTNIFNTIKHLWQGKNPDTGEYFIPVWMRPASEWEWYKKLTEEREKTEYKTDLFYTLSSLWNGKNPLTGETFLPEWMTMPIGEMDWYQSTLDYVKTMAGDVGGTLKSLWNGKDPVTGEAFLPEWMTMPISEMDWYKDTIDYVKTMASDPKATLKALWNGKDPVTGQSFLPEWMTKPINEMKWFKDTVKFYDDIVASDYGQILNLPTSDEISTAIASLTDMIYNKKTGEVFGMNLDDLKNLLPKLQDIVDKIISSLPKWMRPNTIQEQIEDLTKQLEVVKNTKVVGEEGGYIVDLPGRMDTQGERTQAMVDLQAKIDELKAGVFGYNVPSGNLTMQDTQHMRVKTDTLNLAAKDNTGYNTSGMYNQNGSGMNVANQVNQGDTIVGTSNHMHLEKAVNHPLLTFSEAAFINSGGASNN